MGLPRFYLVGAGGPGPRDVAGPGEFWRYPRVGQLHVKLFDMLERQENAHQIFAKQVTSNWLLRKLLCWDYLGGTIFATPQAEQKSGGDGIPPSKRCSEQSRRKAVTQSHGANANFSPSQPGRQRKRSPDQGSLTRRPLLFAGRPKKS